MTKNGLRSFATVAVLSLSALALPQIAIASQAPASEQVAQNTQTTHRISSDHGNGVRGPHGHCGVGCLHSHNGA
jgi:hypothetical protein